MASKLVAVAARTGPLTVLTGSPKPRLVDVRVAIVVAADSLDKVVKPKKIVEDSRDNVDADSRDKVANQVSRGCSSDRSDDSLDRFCKARRYTGKPRRRTRRRSRRRRQRLNVKKGKDVSDHLSDMSADSQNKART